LLLCVNLQCCNYDLFNIIIISSSSVIIVIISYIVNSAIPSKFRAKMSIAAIWAIAFVLATPMAIALRVQFIEYGDRGQ